MMQDSNVMEEGKYVYCVIKSPEQRDFGQIGIGQGSNRSTPSTSGTSRPW
jgi:hypothetical protein